MEDPIQRAVQSLFGLDYLFPYQRLVITNILEAASGSGVGILWPDQGEKTADFCEYAAEENPSYDELDSTDSSDELTDDRAALGRQIVILPTGAGKSLCFQLPAMLLDGPTLVIYPILSLMADQDRRLSEKNFLPVTLRGGQSREERDLIFRKIIERESRFVIANPEVLLTPAVLQKLPELGLVHIVIDESHCVSEWGESFRPSYLEIGRIIEAAGAPVITAFTATASTTVLEKIDKYIFGGQGAHRIIGNPDRANICYHALGTLLRERTVRGLLETNEKPAIVFCSSRPGTEKLARYLRIELGRDDIKFYHAGLSREEKAKVEKWFFDSPSGTLIATCAYGMGVDKSNIRTVIHRDCPPSVEAYLQESGRAGRDGKPSKAFFLWGPEDERAMTRAKTSADKERLAGLLAFGHRADVCRRDALLDLLGFAGERSAQREACCDVCEGSAKPHIIEETALVSFFRRNPRSYTTGEATGLIASSDCGWSETEARSAIRELIRAKKLRASKNFLWKEKLSTFAAR